ncbi:MAG: rRNA methyltransferase [Rhodothalassiaceae bacterium]|nr:MAG: rRNA methyltransferase [Rhodothalassiaceae bacterium]
MRGYFAIGIERVSKPGNVGNLIRTAHGFGAAFVFAIRPNYRTDPGPEIAKAFSDTARSADSLPYYEYGSIDELVLPKGCRLVGVEITDDAIDLPSFRHPVRAAYILGGERLGLSAETLARCDFVVKIPTRFSLNVATAGAILMYDRLISYGRFAPRPVRAGGPSEELPEHVHGDVRFRRHLAGGGNG